MSLKKLIAYFKDASIDLHERFFYLLSLMGLCALVFAIFDSILIGEDKIIILILVVAFFVFLGIIFFSAYFNKTRIGSIIISAIVVYLVVPLIFLTADGIYGGAPIYFIFGVVFISLVIEDKIKYFLLATSFIIDGICYYISYTYPTQIIHHSFDMAHIDSFVSVLIVGTWVSGMIIYQRSLYERENELVKQQSKEIEKLNQAQNRFFSSMSHEIRTPINTIIGLNEMILREAEKKEVIADAINVQGASKMLLTLIDDLLDMSKLESGKMSIVPATYDVSHMLSDIVNMIWVRAKEKELEFRVDVDPKVPLQLEGDEVRIKQILINVLNNAVKYTQSGSVTLSIQSTEDSAGYTKISYSVTDTGMGIKKENLPYIFNAFQRVDEHANRYIEGTGLGLSIVKQLVDLMGGDITVNSVYTKGSTFVITIPQKIMSQSTIGNFNFQAQNTYKVEDHYKKTFEAPKAKVLIVDDNQMNLRVASKLLANTKMNITAVESGIEALKKTLQTHYHLILMDHLMPGMDGIECFHAIRNQVGGLNTETPVVIVTANADEESKMLYRKEGLDGYLSKPIVGPQIEQEIIKQLPPNLVNTINEDGSVGIIEAPVLTYKTKMAVAISTDSVCDLPQDLITKHQISVMPYRVITDHGDFLDGIETDTDSILSYMSEMGRVARSESPSVLDYEDYFAQQLVKANYVIHISMAKKVSNGYKNALEASKNFDNVIVVDSGHLSSGLGLIVLKASECAREGKSADDIVNEISQMEKFVKTSFVVNSTEYLARTGRMSHKMNRLCRALMFHPVLVLKKSSIKVGKIRMGSKDYVYKKYISSTLNAPRSIDRKTLFITYAGMTKEELMEIKNLVSQKVIFDNIIFQKASPAISINCGPGSFGLLFMTK